jgi:hypothetical protein
MQVKITNKPSHQHIANDQRVQAACSDLGTHDVSRRKLIGRNLERYGRWRHS